MMIVDLLRNDLGTISKIGSVDVPHLFTIEKYPTVYQMTATITAETDNDFIQVFKALFPCGSITGAPKIRTMDIISELESTPRDVYCGAIGYMAPNKQAVFNVPIRTVMINNKTGKAAYGVGGGITWDSTVEEEYEEMQTKTRFLKEKQVSFQLLETFGLIDGSYIAYEQHIFRIEKSATYFDFSVDLTKIQESLAAIAYENSAGNYRVRLLVEKDGTYTVDVAGHHPIETPVNVALANEAISKDNIFLYHKTTNRSIYEHFKKQHPEAFDVLLWNENQEVTEFTIGNVIIELEGHLYTPPVTCGLLPGTFRQKLLDENKMTERKITVDELRNCKQIWLINSLRKWVNVKIFE
ncbi:hypothetical protein EU245_11480 [Lentibacillus lipolyticus]|nr:hypothetical protein EU245_11480 [Lentibacillus lipolyticus]